MQWLRRCLGTARSARRRAGSLRRTGGGDGEGVEAEVMVEANIKVKDTLMAMEPGSRSTRPHSPPSIRT